jgi:hypothetical protein
MIELLQGLPTNVVGFEAVGEVTSKDYRDVLDPAIKAAVEANDRIRILYVLADRFTGYSGPAMFEDAVVGTEHWRHWERIGVVTDTAWVRHTVNAFAWMVPGRIRVFADAERDAATSWVSEN